jgi:phosphatidate cytidylyltransferase
MPGDGEILALAAFAVALPLQYLLVYLGAYPMFAFFVPAFALVVLPVIARIAGGAGDFREAIAKWQWGLVICVLCISHVPALLTLDIPGYEGRNLLLIAFLVLVVQLSDVLQYVWGMLAGRRKVAPAVSPAKTWEGLIGGVASATTVGAALYWITPFTLWQAAVVAFAINVMGVAGGFLMSAIKRGRGVKDWGRMIEGHGGMLDRIDSLVFAAPVFFYLLHYGWA